MRASAAKSGGILAALLAAALPTAFALAAIESLTVRLRLPWRSLGAALFGEALLLWGAFALLASIPAWATLRLIPRGRDRGRVCGVLLVWLLAPVSVHAVLDRFVGLAANLGQLEGAGPWLAVAGALGGSLLAGFLLARGVRRFGGRGSAAVVLLAAILVGCFVRTEARSPSGPGGSSAADDRPNLLLLVWDTTRADRLVPYGFERPTTPHLDRFAREATLFERATSTATFTFSSHLSMLTGVYPSTHGARLLSIRYDPRRARTLTGALRRAGYRTGAFVGTDVLAGRTGLRHGFEVYDDRVDPMVCDTYAWSLVHDLQAVAARAVPALRGNGSPHWFQDFQRPADEVLSSAAAWIANGDPRPWFCFVNLYDVHWPYLPRGDGLALVSSYSGPLDGYLFRSDRWKPGTPIGLEDRRHVDELYQGELVELDQAVDRFLAGLHLGGGDTAVIVTSDHGEAFGEAGRWKHEDILEPQVHVPLLLRPAASKPVARRVRERASGVDVAPTLLALAGLPIPEDMEGRSLLDPLPPDRPVFVEDRDHLDPGDVRVALYRDSFKLVRLGLGETAPFQLYDLNRDALDVEDVSGRHPEVLAELRALFLARRAERDAADRSVGVEDQRAADGLQALGYAGN